MDISAFLVSQQTDPQSRALAANALMPGIGGREEEQTYDAMQSPSGQDDPIGPDNGAIPMPGGPGMDWGSLDQGGGSAQDYTQQDNLDQEQLFEDGGQVLSDKFGTDEIGNIEDRRDENPSEGGSAYEGMTSQSAETAKAYPAQAASWNKDKDAYHRARWNGVANKLGAKFFDEGGGVEEEQAIQALPEEQQVGALPMPEGAPTTPDANDAQQVADTRAALQAAIEWGYNHHAVNRPVPDETQEGDTHAMLMGAGATPSDQARQAIEGAGGSGSKAMQAVYDFYNKKGWGDQVDPSQFETRSPVSMASDALQPGPEQGPGAQAAWSVLQYIRGVVGKAFGMARAAADQGNTEVAATALAKGLKDLPDDVDDIQVTPTPEGNFSVKSALGRFGVELDKNGLHTITTTPFDKAVHMGTKQLVQSAAVPASVNMDQARVVRARMTRQDEPLQSEAGEQQTNRVPTGSNDGQILTGPNRGKILTGTPSQPGEQQGAPGPINVLRGGYGLQQVDPEGKVIYDRGDRTNPVLSHERIAAGQEQSRQEVARITAQGRLAAQGDGMAKRNPEAEKRLTMEQWLRYMGPPLDKNGRPDEAAFQMLKKRISDDYDAGRIKPGQMPGGGPQPGQQQGTAPAAAPQPAQSRGNTPPRGTPGARWTNPHGEQYEYTTNYQGQSGWKKVNRLPTG